MAQYRGFDILDYFLIIVKWRKFFIITFFSILVLAYLSIFFFVEEQYDSTAIVIPSEETQFGGISSLLKGFSDLPLGLAGNMTSEVTELYGTIIYSRTNLEKMTIKFDLMHDYQLESLEKTVETLSNMITAEEINSKAYEITIRANSPQKAADMTNYMVELLNQSVIELNIKKAKENRFFLENRFAEIQQKLRVAEDSLRFFQEVTNLYSAEDQMRSIIEAYTQWEADLAVKKVELSVSEKLIGYNSPQTEYLRINVNELEKKLKQIKRNGEENSLIIPIDKLPGQTLQFFRYFRKVEIYNAMLTFIIPLYEQAKFDEQKEIPVLQVLDSGIAPEKRAYPKRVITASAITLIVMLILLFVIILKEIWVSSQNPKFLLIKSQLSKKNIV